MATSNSRDFTLTKQEIINTAFQYINVYDLDEAPSAKDYNFASKMLNMLIKQWQAEDIKLWNRKQATLFTAYQTNQYGLGSAGAHCTQSYANTTLSAAEALGQTVLSVTSSTGMTAGDYVGIELDDSTRQWTTIVSVDSSTQITVTDSLTAAAASGNTVVAYTTKIDRPLMLHPAIRWSRLSDSTENPIELVRYDKYFNIPTKNSYDTPNLAYYDKQLTTGQLYLWPTPDDVDIIIKLVYYESLEDLDNDSDNIDFPQEWILALTLNLAGLLAVPYGKLTEFQPLAAMALQLKQVVSDFNTDEASIMISPDLEGYC